METAKRSKSKSKGGKTSASSLLKAYRTTVLTDGQKPASIFKFCADNGITESEFYSYFGSFDALEKSIWKEYLSEVVARLTGDSSYEAFSAREKMLSFYFTLAEVLKADRSFVLLQLKEWKNKAILPGFLKGFKAEFDLWIEGVIASGKQTEEIAKRPYLDRGYDQLFWMHLLFILQFWSRDDSANFEKTDAAIEKSVNLAFDVIGKGILDNALDFGKFLYQSSRN